MRATVLLTILALAVGCDSDSDSDTSTGIPWNIAPPTISLYEPGRWSVDPVVVEFGSQSPPEPMTTSEGVILLTGSARPLDAFATIGSVDWRNETTGTSGVAPCSAGAWSALVPLVPGTNRVRITASDSSGNWGEAAVEITFVP